MGDKILSIGLVNARFGSYMLIAGLFAILLCSFVSAVAVGGIYSDIYPLEAYPGESKEISFTLQNMAAVEDGGSDVKFKASVDNGAEVASIMDSGGEYLVSSGASDVKVNVLVKVPANAQVGQTYDVKIAFNPIPTGNEEAGMIQIALGLSRYFTVKIIEKPAEPIIEKPVAEKKSNLLFWIVLVVIIVAIAGFLGYLIWKRRK